VSDRVFIEGKRVPGARVADIRAALASGKRVVMDDGTGIAIELSKKTLDWMEAQEKSAKPS
jgi:ubiquinone/menaquinone biosynthesis C-methylase UbiE